MAKTRKMRRGTRRLRKMRGRGLFNTMKAKASNLASKTSNLAGRTKSYLTPSNATKNKFKQATFAVTPSQAKMNYMRNKAGKATNLTRRAVSGVASGVGSVGKGIYSGLESGLSSSAGLVHSLGRASGVF